LRSLSRELSQQLAGTRFSQDSIEQQVRPRAARSSLLVRRGLTDIAASRALAGLRRPAGFAWQLPRPRPSAPRTMRRQSPPAAIDLARRIELDEETQVRFGCRAASTHEEPQFRGDCRLAFGQVFRESGDRRPDRDRLFSRQRTCHPQAVPARARGCKELAQVPVAKARPLGDVNRQRHESEAAGQPGVVRIGNRRPRQHVGRTAAARSLHRIEAAHHGQRSVNVKPARRREREPFAHATVAKGLRRRPHGSQLPLRSFRIRAVFQSTNRASLFERPQEERWC
jgi:hypothetical protein